jgi:hypothetical protein
MDFPCRTILLACAAALTGCAPYVGSCGWVVPEAGASVETVDVRKPVAAECNCMNCGAPGRFLIERDGYTMEFWNGDRWYPELFVSARDKDGRVLTLSSTSPDLVEIAPHVSKSGFEYFVPIEQKDDGQPAKSLTLKIIDADGRVMGEETVSLRVEFRKDIGIEGV